MAAATASELLALKARCAELDLLNSQNKQELLELRRENSDLRQQLQDNSGALASRATNIVRDENFALEKEVLALTEQKASLEAQLSRANDNIAQLHKSIAKEVQKAKDEVDRQSVFLRSQLLEQKERNTELQEKLLTAMNLSQQLHEEGMHEVTAETILITSDAVLQRFRQESRSTSFKGKYDVDVDFSGRQMILRGRKVNVQLLKAEVLQHLNEMFNAMVDPSKYVSAAKAKDDAARSEMDHLRRTVMTHEATIQSLHLALQHAQDRSTAAIRGEEEAKRALAVAQAKLIEEQAQAKSRESDWQRTVETLQRSQEESETTNSMALNSLKAEAAVSSQYRAECCALREQLRVVSEEKSLAQRANYVVQEQLESIKREFHNLVQSHAAGSDAQRKLIDAQSDLADTNQKIAGIRRECDEKINKQAKEIGVLTERLRQASEDVGAAKREISAVIMERDAARSELQSSRDLITELRQRMMNISYVELSRGEQSTIPVMPQPEIPGHTADRRVARLEEENSALRNELQQAFEDMRAIATTLKETRAVRERALGDIERLENEKGRLVEERMKVERKLAEERMASRQRETELELEVMALREEHKHEKQRTEMLHIEYQKKIQQHLDGLDVQQQVLDEIREQRTIEHARITHLHKKGRPGSQERPQPNDPSQIPARTPLIKTTLRSPSTEANTPASVFRLSAAKATPAYSASGDTCADAPVGGANSSLHFSEIHSEIQRPNDLESPH